MDGLWFYWLLFIISAIIIILSGTKLSITADELAQKTGMGRIFIGSLLLALSTSLPEIVTIISAVAIDAPDLAMGNIFGSCNLNFLILVIVDLYHGPGPIMLETGLENLLLAFFGVLLLALASFFLITYSLSLNGYSLAWMGWESLFILLAYLSGSRLIYRYQKRNSQKGVSTSPSLKPLSSLIWKFSLASFFILLSGITIAWTGEILALQTGLGESFIGTLLIGLSTSLPELITTLTAVKIAAYDLAVGNILGSNMINITMISIADLFYKRGPILKDVSLIHGGTASLGILLTIITAIGLFYRSKKTILGSVGWDTASIFILYILGIYLLFF